VQRAALILHVTDAASPTALEQDAQVTSVLRELDADTAPRLHVLNKIDLLAPPQRESLRDTAGTVHISAVKQIGLNALLEAIDLALGEGHDPVSPANFRVPQSEGKILAQLEARTRIHARRYREGWVELEVQAPESLLRRLRQYVVP
jgi:GTP-binding protein HflX